MGIPDTGPAEQVNRTMAAAEAGSASRTDESLQRLEAQAEYFISLFVDKESARRGGLFPDTR